MGFIDRLQHAWNVFIDGEKYTENYGYRNNITYIGSGSSYNVARPIINPRVERSTMTAVYNRIALDCAEIEIRHVKVDKDGKYIQTVDSGLNECLNVSANKDQTGKQFILDAVLSMFDEGYVALVPVDTDENTLIDGTKATNIESLRTGKIVKWYPDHVQVNVYNDHTGQRKDILLPKKSIAIVENPLYAIMNESNSTHKRLIHKLSLLDLVDEQTSSGKLNLIVQLPYIIKTDARKAQAKERLSDIENQLTSSKHGIVYTDGTEKITQLNRPIENNLLEEIKHFTELEYSLLGITNDILNGTANEQTMMNYRSRIVEPIMNALKDEIKRKFLTKTARTQGHTIMVFSDRFQLVPMNNLAEIADKFTRNAILSSNEVRQILGMKPVDDPDADALRNKNLNMTENQTETLVDEPQEEPEEPVRVGDMVIDEV